MNKGHLEPIELTTQVTDYVVYEFGLHLLLTALAAINMNLVVFFYCLPVAIYHIHKYTSKQYKIYAVTREEYKMTEKHVTKEIKMKMAYYVGLVLLTGFVFALSISNMVAYHLFGYTMSNIIKSKLS
jgi:hypothetical protein